MKKFVTTLLALLMLLQILSTTAGALDQRDYDSMETISYTEYLDDGSYIIITIEQSPIGRSSTYTVTGRKHVELFNSSDELQWRYTLIGTYTVVDGVSAVCTNSTYSSTIYNDKWSLTAHSNRYSGNTAYGTATYKKKVLFVTTSTQDIDIYITCDIYGSIQ